MPIRVPYATLLPEHLHVQTPYVPFLIVPIKHQEYQQVQRYYPHNHQDTYQLLPLSICSDAIQVNRVCSP
jgi:hypothetical protein